VLVQPLHQIDKQLKRNKTFDPQIHDISCNDGEFRSLDHVIIDHGVADVLANMYSIFQPDKNFYKKMEKKNPGLLEGFFSRRNTTGTYSDMASNRFGYPVETRHLKNL
jgi:hypothetical protein